MTASLAHALFWATDGNYKMEDFFKLDENQKIFYYASMLLRSEELKKEREKVKK